MLARPLRRRRGFTLLEILVAVIIFGVAAGVILGIYSESFARIRRAETDMAAQGYARSLLESAGHEYPLRGGDSEGRFANGFVWRLHIEPYGDDDDRKAWGMQAYNVAATVSWNDGGRERSVTLVTLRLAAKGS
ncbi:MAG: type II secretion system protein [Bdellovibrionales bacterium]